MLEITYPTLGYKGREKYTLQRLPDAFCTTIVYTDCKGTCRYRYVTSYYVAGNKWVADFLPVAETNSRDRPLIVHGFAKKLQGKAYFHKKKNRSLNRKPSDFQEWGGREGGKRCTIIMHALKKMALALIITGKVLHWKFRKLV